MKLSKYIQHLQAIMGEHGDLSMKKAGAFCVQDASPPEVCYMQKVMKYQPPHYWTVAMRDSAKGEKVVGV